MTVHKRVGVILEIFCYNFVCDLFKGGPLLLQRKRGIKVLQNK